MEHHLTLAVNVLIIVILTIHNCEADDEKEIYADVSESDDSKSETIEKSGNKANFFQQLKNLDNKRKAFRQTNELFSLIESRTDVGSDNKDCLVETRNRTRSAPTTCYDHVYMSTYGNVWQSFFAEIRPDLQYAFDFVLYDPYDPYKKENQLWYLILYLKRLASTVSDPEDFIDRATFKMDYDSAMEGLQKIRRTELRLRELVGDLASKAFNPKEAEAPKE